MDDAYKDQWMDPCETFPLEICWRIFDLLSPQDLCKCLGVSQRWRMMANTELLWKRFCTGRALSQPASKEKDPGLLPLCPPAEAYIDYMKRLVTNWRECRYDSFLLPKVDWCCCIAAFRRIVAVYYPRTSKVLLYHVSTSVEFIQQVYVALPHGLSIPDVFINEYFLVVSRGNVVLIYKNNEDYRLYKVVVANEFGLTIANDMFPIAENGKRLYVKVICENTIWMESDNVYVYDIAANTYRVVNDTFRCLRFDSNHIYAANDVVSCYDLRGDKQFSLNIKCVRDMWVKGRAVIVLRGDSCQHLEVWDIKSRAMQCAVNVQKDPCVSISRDAQQMFVLDITSESYVVSCYSTLTGSSLWTTALPYQRDIAIHPEIRIICDRFVFARPSYNCDTNFILLDTKWGKVIYDSMMPPCLLPPCYIYHLSDEFFITAESNVIHIRSYL